MQGFSKKPTRDELNALVDRAADLIRTAVDYKFILVLLFIKRVNDLWKHEKETVKQRLVNEAALSDAEVEKELRKKEYYTFNIPKEHRWDEITKDVKNLPEKLATVISEIAKQNEGLQGGLLCDPAPDPTSCSCQHSFVQRWFLQNPSDSLCLLQMIYNGKRRRFS